MPQKRLAMRHISEVLRLAAQGHSQREISSSVGISRTSVRNYLARARRAGLSWPLPEQLDAAVVEARLFKRTDDGVDRIDPNPIGWTSTASTSAASTSHSNCCISSTSKPTRTAGATPSSAATTIAGSAARTWSCAWSTPLASACLSISPATRCQSSTPSRAEPGRRTSSSACWARAAT